MLLTIPTYRLQDAAKTAHAYRKHFRRFGHETPILVFDDSPVDIWKRDFPEFMQQAPTGTLYVGPVEKEQYLERLIEGVGPSYESGIRKLLRPSYGGNRNFTLLYTLGNLFMSFDDDMTPFALESRESLTLGKNEIFSGVFRRKQEVQQKSVLREYDLVRAYLEILGREVQQAPSSFLRGDTLQDSMSELYSNTSLSSVHEGAENTLVLQPGFVNEKARVIVAQSFKTGFADLDAVDFAKDILDANNHTQHISLIYLARNHRPCVTSTNWRFETGVAAYDNREGLPPFIPTELRTEEYIFRIFLQHYDLAAAHVDAVQGHLRATTMRRSISYDIFNEEVVSVLREKLRLLTKDIAPTTIAFERDGHIGSQDAARMIEHVRVYHAAALERATHETEARSKDYFFQFAEDLEHYYCGFQLEPFRSHVEGIVVKELESIIEAMEIWPSVLEAASDIQQKGNPPMRRI